MKSYVLLALPVGSNRSSEWLAINSSLKLVCDARDALSAIGAYGLEIRPITNGQLGKPLTMETILSGRA